MDNTFRTQRPIDPYHDSDHDIEVMLDCWLAGTPMSARDTDRLVQGLARQRNDLMRARETDAPILDAMARVCREHGVGSKDIIARISASDTGGA